jgi:YegS/Rv2252/BmrU family lipid kinase
VKILYVLNPAAGGGRTAGLDREIPLVARRIGLPGDVAVTAARDHATEIARDAARRGYDLVVSIGGDGTAGETAAGLLGTGTTLAVLPAGTGNDLAGELRLPRRWRSALAALPHATRRWMDVGRANGRPFLQSAGVGADAFIAQLRQRERVFSGPLAYAKCAVQGLLQCRPAAVAIDVDGQEIQLRALAVTLANGARYGGGLRIAPGARTADGLLDVAVVGDMSRREALGVFPTVYFGRHVGHPKFRLQQGRRITVTAADPGQSLPLHVDGTPHGGTPVQFSIEPRCLAVLSLA